MTNYSFSKDTETVAKVWYIGANNVANHVADYATTQWAQDAALAYSKEMPLVHIVTDRDNNVICGFDHGRAI